MLTRKFFFSVVIYILISIPIAFGQQLTVAAAANLQAVMPILQADFKKRTGISADIIIGSSGKLVAQISNGAPYDVFLSADMELPEKLYKDGATLAKPVIYATGSLIICSINKKSLTNWQQVLTDPQVKKIAIANPSVAPYGAAAME
ncbi:MAG: molybdate ABC transporter substrate-binding protein, partial [Sphingobacteriales bacterium]